MPYAKTMSILLVLLPALEMFVNAIPAPIGRHPPAIVERAPRRGPPGLIRAVDIVHGPAIEFDEVDGTSAVDAIVPRVVDKRDLLARGHKFERDGGLAMYEMGIGTGEDDMTEENGNEKAKRWGRNGGGYGR